jgi:hypothetical protein
VEAVLPHLSCTVLNLQLLFTLFTLWNVKQQSSCGKPTEKQHSLQSGFHCSQLYLVNMQRAYENAKDSFSFGQEHAHYGTFLYSPVGHTHPYTWSAVSNQVKIKSG